MAGSVIKPQPQDGLIQETGQQYFQGTQPFKGTNTAGQVLKTTFNTDLIFYDSTPGTENYALNNFKIYTSASAIPGSWTEKTTNYSVNGNDITFTTASSDYIVVQLKILDGGKYGNTIDQKAFGQTVEDNYGGYQYVKLQDIVNNFMVAFVGEGKLILDVKRTDIIFHAKRAIQEFSYDTLKSIKSSELSIPNSLTLVLPQDYVNYVKLSWVDQLGVLRPIYPTNNLTTSPYNTQIQDSSGVPTQDNYGNDVEGTSQTQERWHNSNIGLINGDLNSNNFTNEMWAYNWDYGGDFFGGSWGQMFGLEPQTSQVNGWFNMNEREGKVSFSSNLKDKLIIFEYISDGLATDMDTRVPKLAEDAMYSYITHAVIASRIGQPEYIVQRLKREKSAKLRNAKIRLSNIKLDEIVQVMRGKSKWLKH